MSDFSALIEMALREDVGAGDVTSDYFVDPEAKATAVIAARASGVVSGIQVAVEVFQQVDPTLKIEGLLEDGNHVAAGAFLLRVSGKACSILTAERTALNFLQRLSGIATQTSLYAAAVSHTKTRVLDTRKTTPGYRLLEKKAVLDGGGVNHRMGLYDRAMVKDNHLASFGSNETLQDSILRLKKEKPEVQVELEADDLQQVEEFLKLRGVDFILLDNMSNEEMRAAVQLNTNSEGVRLEASGGITLERMASIAETGVDFISVGALTHSSPSLDLGLDFIASDE